MRLANKKDRIRKHLEAGHSLTADDARRMFGTMRLAARIKELKDEGVLITAKKITVRDRNGVTCRVAKYSLIHEAQLTLF